jgi:DNA-directed RNA polymerase specialized sigma subunit
VKISLSQRYSGKAEKALKEIGRHFNIGESGVSQASRGIAFKLSQNKQLREKVSTIEGKLGL